MSHCANNVDKLRCSQDSLVALSAVLPLIVAQFWNGLYTLCHVLV